MITANDLLNFNVYKKEPHTGSDRGMRYMLRKEEIALPVLDESGTQVIDEEGNPSVEKINKLAVYVWPEPYCFEKTQDELKTRIEFEFSPKGQSEALAWLNAVREERNDEWERVVKC